MLKFKQLILPAYIAIFIVNACAGKTNLQLMLNNLMKSQDIKKAYVSGILLTVQDSSKNISTLASGTISHELNAQILPVDGIFQAGSITKTFIGVLSVKLATKGYFGYKGLNSTVGDILGNQPSTISWNSKWNGVKLRQLLNMTSGIPDFTDNDPDLINQQYNQNPYHFFTVKNLLHPAASNELLYIPGHGYNYSNTNYVIMEIIISKVTGHSLQQQLIQHIFTPLHLNHTYYVENIPEDAITKVDQKSLLISGYYVGDDISASFKTKYLYKGVNVKPYSLSSFGAGCQIISNTSDM
jgi:D-alanyl-D-alanine carboxypeptidase